MSTLRNISILATVVGVTLLMMGGPALAGEIIKVVVPNERADVEGQSSGHSNSGVLPCRIQFICPTNQLAALGGRPHRVLGFRTRPSALPSGEISGPRTFSTDDLLIRLSTTNATPPLSLEYANNIGADETVVYSGPFSMHTEFTGPANGPKEFDFEWMFQEPFLYDPSEGNLLVDITFSGWGVADVQDWVDTSYTGGVWDNYCIYRLGAAYDEDYAQSSISPIIVQYIFEPAGDIPKGYFTDVQVINELSGPYEDFKPCISYDELSLFFSRGASNAHSFFMATRTSVDKPFGNIRALTEINSYAQDSGITITPDGLTIIFSSSRNGSYDLFQATRTSTNESFGNITPLTEINTSYAEWSPSMSADGLILVFSSSDRPGYGSSDIWICTRGSTDQPWGAPENVGPNVNTQYSDYSPSLSSDGLALFFSDSTGAPYRPGGKGLADIWVSTRPSTADQFGTPVNINDLWPGTSVNSSNGEGFVWISPNWPENGSKLYFNCTNPSGDILQATWMAGCEYDLLGDLNGDYRVDFCDLCLMLDNWLVDCHEDPDNLACVLK